MRGLNIVIAGCGPSGLAAALLLRRAGHHVTLFERFDTPRPTGSGLMIQPTGMAVLDQLGLLDEVLERGSRIDRLFGKAGKRVVLDVRYAALRHRRVWHRADRLDGWREAGLAPWKERVSALWPDCAPLLDQIHDPDQLTFVRYAHRTLAAPADRRWFILAMPGIPPAPSLGRAPTWHCSIPGHWPKVWRRRTTWKRGFGSASGSVVAMS